MASGLVPGGQRLNRYRSAAEESEDDLTRIRSTFYGSVALRRAKGTQQSSDSQSIEYLAYETLPFEPSLFRPPEGIAMQNSR